MNLELHRQAEFAAESTHSILFNQLAQHFGPCRQQYISGEGYDLLANKPFLVLFIRDLGNLLGK